MDIIKANDYVSWKFDYHPRRYGHVISLGRPHGRLVVYVRTDNGMRITLPGSIITKECG